MSLPGGTLGIDTAAAWGWCYVAPDGAYVASGHRKLTDTSLGARVHAFSMSVSDLITEYAPEHVAIEKPNSPHYGAARSLFAYAAAAEMVAHIRECKYSEIVRSAAYKAVVGKGAAPKSAGVVFGRQFKPLLNNDNESDAILVALASHKQRCK